jgi:GH15 family glucan-1,4-alpha-glucosidase
MTSNEDPTGARDVPPGPPAIGDYAIIGDCRSAALVSRWGSIDWLCWPRFDNPSLFAALLDPERGGRFAVHPAGRFTAQRRYVEHSNVLETTFHAARGVLRLTDLMPVASEAERRRALMPDHHILRQLECVSGEVEVEVVCDPRPDYGRVMPRLVRRGVLGIYYEHRGRALILRADFPLALSGDRSDCVGRVTLGAGERRYVSLVGADGVPAVLPPLGEDARRAVERSVRWWQDWSGRCTYEGPYRESVVRSALTLKLMCFAPSGAVVAAPTTSLPEWPGGVRNWDYRYCWLRDASLTLQALFDLGYHAEAEAFLSWLLYTTRLTRPQLQIMYDVYGESRLRERELPRLAGFAGSRPVRTGNGARSQLQMDVYGEVLDAAYEFIRRGGRLDRTTARMLLGLGETVCRRWREPDEGIWETRGGRRHHTYSKAMCWVALDRLLRLHDERHLQAPAERYRREAAAIHAEVEAKGFNEQLDSYVDEFGGAEVDASLLLLARYGYGDAAGPRMRGTYRRIRERLGADGLLYRYQTQSGSDGLPGNEGAFGICSFWAATCLALQGELDEAARTFEHVLGYANDVGLLSEEFDPKTGAALGNFPQAFTHVGLIDAALTLAHATGQRARPGRERPATLTATRL